MGDRPHAAEDALQEQSVALEYPNGRTHLCTIKTPYRLTPGIEFELFGRVWRVKGVQPSGRDALPGVACLTVGHSPPPNDP
jgi:hypothetical protein